MRILLFAKNACVCEFTILGLAIVVLSAKYLAWITSHMESMNFVHVYILHQVTFQPKRSQHSSKPYIFNSWTLHDYLLQHGLVNRSGQAIQVQYRRVYAKLTLGWKRARFCFFLFFDRETGQIHVWMNDTSHQFSITLLFIDKNLK